MGQTLKFLPLPPFPHFFFPGSLHAKFLLPSLPCTSGVWGTQLWPMKRQESTIGRRGGEEAVVQTVSFLLIREAREDSSLP